MQDLGQIDTGVSNETIFEQSLYDDVTA
jgi:hypothetical protein